MRLTTPIALAFALGAYAVQRERIALESLRDECRISFPNAQVDFDLCPLLKDHGHLNGVRSVEKNTPPTITTTTYSWNLAGALPHNESIPEEEQCPSGTWFCKIVTNKHHSKDDARVTQVIPIAGELSKSEDVPESTHVDPEASLEDTTNQHDVLYVRLYGGHYSGDPQHALVGFRCNTEVSEPTSPIFAGTWNNTHLFTWTTRHACASGPGVYRDSGDQKQGDEDSHEEEETPALDDDRPQLNHHRSWALWVAWLSAGMLLLSLLYVAFKQRLHNSTPGYMFSSMKRATRTFARWHPLAPLYRRFTFRVGEDALVRWAREEEDPYLSLDTMDERPSSGFGRRGATIFVAEPEDDRFLGQDDEMLPLTPSPRKGGIKRYV